ncbi:beta strand repeat-containing protein [Microseira wollei]|uniref:Filamentous hemagglutinin-like protein n=1 Tax=Microseira wollei NIES-4236 TaxID=2530354 RepID=A0AAV3XGT7_9CYAN|nr:S-layer family protein [Microseira wollei]GET41828.1 filamentous hemagglutinin-like protein [Microseira wollei NIES-4236]
MKLWCLQGVAYAASTLLFSIPAAAQIVPDATLPVNSIVTPNGNSLTIDGGSRAGGNLFHSFKEFSLPTGGEAFFNNTVDVQNIFSRVTGSNISHIDGLIRANGRANLFLLNPNGIVFGPHARLNIGGSFIGSTASSINFADGTQFSATNPTVAPLLTVSVPIGLGFGSHPGPITAQGTGHNLTTTHAEQTPYVVTDSNTGLGVQPGRTLALVGGNVTLNGMTLTAPGGRIELGSVAEGIVGFNPISQEFVLDYAGANDFRDLRLQQRSLADVSGVTAGSIQVQGRQVILNDASVLWSQNRGSLPGGSINVRAAESVEMGGYIPSTRIRSGLVSETLGTGTSGDITVSTQRLISRGAGGIFNRTFSQGTGGDVIVNASELVEFSGFVPKASNTISAYTLSTAKAGNIAIFARRLFLSDGGIIASTTFNRGAGGNITVNAEIIELIGTSNGNGALFANSFGAGNSGDIAINTRTLILRNGGRLTTASFSTGDGGNINVNASESVEVSDRNPIDATPSRIRSSVAIASESVRRFFPGLPDVPSGASGNLTINTPNLTLTEQGFVSVSNEGVGRGGTLTVNAGSVMLSGNGSFSATTVSGEGGNIALQAQSLQMRRNSSITTTAGLGDGTGNGGNLTINANVIAALENSDISANAVFGQGGNISISTSGIFGTQFRPQPTPESDITASSQFGLSGTVAITNLEVENRSFLVKLPQNLLDTREQITTGCAADRGNTFTVTGRGGLPENPSSGLLGRAVWWDNRDLSQVSQTAQKLPLTETTPEIVEATGFRINAQGQVELVADAASSSNSWVSPTNCQTLPLSSSGLRNLPRHLISSPP